MYRKLNSFADVLVGYAFRRAIEEDQNGDQLVFQAKNIEQGEPFSGTDGLARVARELTKDSGRLQKNDVLLAARGMKAGSFRATVFSSDTTNVLASSSVHIIRIKDMNVLPDYVAHYLNSKEGQDSLAEIVTGAYIGSLSRRALTNISIPIPTPQKQRAIIGLLASIRQQQKILIRKSEVQQNIINEVFKHLAI